MSFVTLLLMIFFAIYSNGTLLDDSQTLLSLKRSLEDPHGQLINWNESNADCCIWKGVVCDESQAAVVGLNFSSMGLTGRLAEKLTDLVSLSTLILDGNDIAGELPSDFFSKLSNLAHVSLPNNNLSGQIPGNFSHSGTLRVVDFQDNDFRGGIPVELGTQTGLTILNLQGNRKLSGSIPSQLCNLLSLQSLLLAYASLEGPVPECFGKLEQLVSLFIGDNKLTGPLPTTIANLKKLQLLDVSNNSLTGTIPAELGSLSSLQVLRLYENRFSGEIPAELGDLSQLVSLDVASNNLEGTLPDELSRLTNLQQFHVYNNSLTGTFPQWLADHPNVIDILLTMNKFHGEIPQNLGANSALSTLDLATNNFTGAVPPDLCKNNALSYLILLDNQFTGELPDSVQRCKSLTRARVEGNKLTGSIHFSAPSLNFITLGNNSFNGTFFIEHAPLEELSISYNQFRGQLPAALGALTRLVKLDLAHNRFSGEVPFELGNLQKLETLDLSGNLFSGEIPASLFNFSNLVQLNLNNNSFSGRLSVGTLPKLSDLDVSHNHLSGEIPPQIGQLPNLEALDLSYNNLSGEVPGFSKKMQLKVDGNPFLCQAESCKKAGEFTWKRYSNASASNRFFMLTAILLGITAFMLVLAGCFCSWRLSRQNASTSTSPTWKIIHYSKEIVPLDDVLDCLKEKNLIACRVYKGQLKNGHCIAVKRLESDGRHDSEFEAELRTLGKMRHRNIVKLLASCTNGKSHLLVYDYMAMGSLRDILHSQTGRRLQLDWNMRLNLIRGIADGLLYLHQDCGEEIVLHRDVKCENILLDAEMVPRLGDFGLAKLLDKGKRSCSISGVAGSLGYIAPEYAYGAKINDKTDVYSFGIVMLELLTGKQATWRDDAKDLNLVGWVMSQRNELPDHIADLEGETSTYQSVLNIALSCVNTERSRRPRMQIVVQKLQDILNTNQEKSKDEVMDILIQ